MRIKKIELIGFKSFKDRTLIHFDAGITGIVGPNGCGKSNIVDALLWVMGEMSAKDLRGSTMTDVIFAGAEGYAPVGMAEVSLVLENDGGPFPVQYIKYSEIMVTRRLHRSGESEYMINKEPARLKDIQEIFMDTGAGSKGFSIIQQGMIGRIITSKPEDRRMLIEEAAGITKFKVRKKESQRKLQATDQNLIRLQDIIGELKRQIESLHRQAQKAERYRVLKTQIEKWDLWLSSLQFKTFKEGREELEKLFKDIQAQESEGLVELQKLNAEVEIYKLQLLEQEKKVTDLQTEHFEKQSLAQKKELEIQELKFEIEQARRNEQLTGSLLQEQQTRRALLEKDFHQLKEQTDSVKIVVEELQTDFTYKNEVFQESQARIQELDEELTTKRRELFALGQGQSSLEGKQTALNTQLSDMRERETHEQEVFAELKLKEIEFEERAKLIGAQFQEEKESQNQMGLQLKELEQKKLEKNSQVKDRQEEVQEFKDSLNQVTSRLYGLENLQNNFEGFDEGVRSVLLWQKTPNGLSRMSQGQGQGQILGLGLGQQDGQGLGQSEIVSESLNLNQELQLQEESSLAFQAFSEVIEVPQEYEMAMEAALGHRLQMLLTKDSTLALDAVNYLRESRSGRSSFYLLDKQSEAENETESEIENKNKNINKNKNKKSNELGYQDIPEGNSVRGVLKNFVKASEKYQDTVNQLLGNTCVIENLEEALRLKKIHPTWAFVTLEGDLIGQEGLITGGQLGEGELREAGLLKRRREIKELSLKKDEVAGKLALASLVLKKEEGELQLLLAEIENFQKAKQNWDIKVAEARKDMERSQTENSNAKYACERQQKEIQRIHEQVRILEGKFEELNRVLVETRQRRDASEELVESLGQDLSSTKMGFETQQQQVMELQLKLATKNQEYQGLRRQWEMVDKSLTDLNQQLSRMTEESHRNVSEMSENQIKLEERKIEFDRLVYEIEERKKGLAQARDLYEKSLAQTRNTQDATQMVQRAQNEIQQKTNEIKFRYEQVSLKEQNLLEQIRDRYMIHLPEVYEHHLLQSPLAGVGGDGDSVIKTQSEAEIELKELREKLAKMGDVNLSAIEEYKETLQRYEFLNQQHEDLIEAKDQLRKVIDRINRIVSKRFKDTFEMVNERFQKVFPVLFGGGEARLELVEDPENNEMGIDIIAKPPGKKMQNISLLSGGEKALTAVALVFSIFLVKPSPYCLLDEVDAPLDDANVSRFNELVREMARRSQIIVVTHNKHTMEVASKLYGVTMQERGVSTMVSVNIQDVA